jgi:transposase
MNDALNAQTMPDDLQAPLVEKDHEIRAHSAILESREVELDIIKTELETTQKTLQEKLIEIHYLKEIIAHYQRKRFGTSSEQQAPIQGELFNEAEQVQAAAEDLTAAATTEVKSHRRIKAKRIQAPLPESLPREERLYDLEDSQKICPHDGTELKPIGQAIHEQLEIIPAQLKVVRHIQQKYACPCCKQHVVTANKPKSPIEGSQAGPSLLTHIALQKYQDALPLNRQAQIFERAGILLHKRNLANWMIQCGQLLQPLINLLQEHCQARTLIHMDETPVQVLNEPGKTAQSQSTMWLMASLQPDPIVLFRYEPTRSGQIPLDWLKDCAPNQSALMVDGYSGYQQACNQYQLKRLGCWAHARRLFVDAQKLHPKGKTGKADIALSAIQKLYRIERQIKDQSPEHKQSVRQQQALPIIHKLKTWLDGTRANVLPKSKLRQALNYLHNQWEHLIGYLDDGHYPIDNNPAERTIRPFTIGRKNWIFSTSQAGAKASANLYSLIETAKANGLNTFDYLHQCLKVLPNANTLEDIEALLPWHYKAGLPNADNPTPPD